MCVTLVDRLDYDKQACHECYHKLGSLGFDGLPQNVGLVGCNKGKSVDTSHEPVCASFLIRRKPDARLLLGSMFETVVPLRVVERLRALTIGTLQGFRSALCGCEIYFIM